jgi:hypothetical protein
MTIGRPVASAAADARTRPWGRTAGFIAITASGSKGGLR